MAKQAVANASASLTLNTTEFSKPLGTARAEMKQFSATMREESAKSRESVKLLSEELGLGIPRGLQKIISTLPGVSTAMNAAFDAVVVLALINTVVEVTEKVAEFIKMSDKAGSVFAASMGKMTLATQEENDKLALSIERMKAHLSEIEKKPATNGAALALAEARVQADELSKSVSADLEQMSKLFEAKGMGKLESFIDGQSGVDDAKKLVQSHIDAIGAVNTDTQNKLAALKPEDVEGRKKVEEEAEIARKKALKDAIDDVTASYNKLHAQSVASQNNQIAFNGDKSRQVNFSPNADPHAHDRAMTILGTSGHEFQEMLNRNNLMDSSNAVTAQTTTAEAQAKGVELAKAADEKYLKDKQDALKKLEAVNAMSLDQEKAYWDAIEKIAPSAGSKKLVGLQIDDVQIQINRKYQSDYLRQLDKDIESKRTADNKHIEETTPPGPNESFEAMEKGNTESVEIAKKAQRDIYESTVADLQTKEKLAELLVKIQEANHELSKSQAVQQLQAIHAQTDAATLDAFGKAQNAGAQFDLKQGVELQGQIAQRSVSDAQAVAQETFSNKMTSDLTKWAEQATDLGNIMSNLFTTSIDQVNDAIIKILTEKNSGQHPFRQAGHAIFTDVSKQGLQSAEGSLMKLFGKGGKDIQKVQVVNWPHGSGPVGSGSGGADGSGTGILGALNRSNLAGKLFGGKLFGPGGIFARGQPGIAGPGAGGPVNQGGAPLSMDNVSDFAPGAPGWVGQMTKYAGIALGAGLSSIEKGAQAPGDSGDDGDSAPGSGSTMQGIPITGSFQGVEAHASGGLLSANTWSLVGENGPELLPPVGQTTRVYDARDTAAMLGGGGNTTNHHWNVDARGSTDPAAVHAAVMRGIKQAAPQLISSAHASSKDHAARKPSSAK